jgi:predicted neutral ceramidase superfamily lipid hydrolase
MEIINYTSIILEAVVAIFGIAIALKKNNLYGWGIALTFSIYVFYDLSRINNWQISSTITSVSFLIATISALFAVYLIYKNK